VISAHPARERRNSLRKALFQKLAEPGCLTTTSTITTTAYTEGGTSVPAALTNRLRRASVHSARNKQCILPVERRYRSVILYELTLGTIGPGASRSLLIQRHGYFRQCVHPALNRRNVVYARLYSYINGAWQHNDYVYTESRHAPFLPMLQSPTPGLSTVLGTSNVSFQVVRRHWV
jgi:hypothetical protein